MADLTAIHCDPTLEAVDRALEAREAAQEERPYLGMSSIGRECERALWYAFRWAWREAFDAQTLRRFEDGHRGEDLMASRLRLVEGIALQTVDPTTGRQLGHSDHGGHFRGHMDGRIQGLLQAPRTPHVWEHKCVGEKKFAALQKAVAEHGEKQALAAWDPVYFAQAQLYMHYSGLHRHYLTCSSAGERDTIGVRTLYDPTAAARLVARAERIVRAQEPPPRVSEKPEFYLCRWCAYSDICHGDTIPRAQCRTCCHATPELRGDGRWSCAKWGDDIPLEFQRTGCEEHLFIPALIKAEAVDASEPENWIRYRAGDSEFTNGGEGFASAELAGQPLSIVTDPGVAAIKKPSAPSWRRQPDPSQSDSSAPGSAAASAGTSNVTGSDPAQASAAAVWRAKA